jgi:arginase family enzyme
MVHFDAHADTGHSEFGSLIGHGQPMRRLIDSGALRGDRFLQIGLRGLLARTRDARLDGAQGMRLYEMTELVSRGLDTCPHRGVRHRRRRLRRLSSSPSTSTSSTPARRPAPGRPSLVG